MGSSSLIYTAARGLIQKVSVYVRAAHFLGISFGNLKCLPNMAYDLPLEWRTFLAGLILGMMAVGVLV
jgi:hypothetical protein